MPNSLPLPTDSLDLIPVPTLALAEDDTLVTANEAARRLLWTVNGVPKGQPFADLVHPDDRGSVDLGEAYGAPLRVCDENGETQHVRLFTRPVDGGGALVCLMPAPADGIVSDISGGTIDATLLARAVHAADNSIVIADVSKEDQPLVFVNQGFVDLTGYDAGDVVGQNCRFLQAPGGANLDSSALRSEVQDARENEQAAEAAQAIQDAISRGEKVDGIVIRNYTRDGRAFWNELFLTPVDNGEGVSHYVGVQNDVTDRVDAQRRLRRQANQLKDLFDAMPQPLGLLEMYDGGRVRHVLANAAAADAFDLGTDTDLSLDGLGFRGEARTAWLDAIRETGVSGEPVQFEAPRADARIFEVIVSAVRRQSERPDEPQRYFYLARDVSKGRQLERDVLDISARALSDVAQNVHDGVGQTLVGASMLSSALSGTLQRQEHAEASEARRLHTLVRQSLTQLRQFALGIDPMDIDDRGIDYALQRLADDTQALFGVHVTYDPLDKPTDLTEALATDIYRTAQEAITNAVRHGHADHIRVELSANNNALTLTVEDDGDGIAADRDETTDGIGMRMMRARARRLGGTLEVGPGPRGGTVVRVHVDRKAAALLNGLEESSGG